MANNTVGSLADLVGGQVQGDRELAITGVNDLRFAEPCDICFVRDAKYLDLAQTSKAGAVLVVEVFDLPATQIIVADVHAAFAKIALEFHPVPYAKKHAIHPRAVVDPGAQIDAPVEIGPMVVIGANVRIGAGSIVQAGSVVGEGCRLGSHCVLYPRVVLYPGVKLGNRVMVHSGCVIGSDGFGYVNDNGRWIKVPQLGGVLIEDDVEIGANSTIDRGTLRVTRIGLRSKLDNLIHIGHNCVIGEDNAMAGFSALGGSTVLGKRVTMGGHVITAGHISICDDAHIGGNSAVRHDVDEPGDYIGYPLQKRPRWGRTLAIMNRLVELQEKVRELGKAKRAE